MSLIQKIKYKNLINGEFVEFSNSDKENYVVQNPATLEEITKVPKINTANIKEAIKNAQAAFAKWKNTSPFERQKFLEKWYNEIINNQNELAEIITLEQGKTFNDSISEVNYGANFVKWFASKALEINGYNSFGKKEGQKINIQYEPVGVVGAITPWNFPNAMITRKIAPAIAAGCSVIVKPALATPLSALALGYLAIKAGMPKGLINIITGNAELVANEFSYNENIRKMTFTGSTKVGKILYKNSSNTIKKLSLELGGNAPFIVCHDADIENSVSALVAAKNRNSGQSCVSPNRIFLHKSIYKTFLSKLKNKLSKLVIGDGLNRKVDIGPLINSRAIEKIEYLIKDALNEGGEIIFGGNKPEKFISKEGQNSLCQSEHNFFKPTILSKCNDNMKIFHEEIFGPIFPCYEFQNIEEVIQRANNTQYGLASYIFTQNLKNSEYLSDKLDFGMVGINEGIISNEIGTFAGRKFSGFGIEGSKLGIFEYLITKYKCYDIS